MTKQQAIDAAKKTASENNCDILVCESPIDVRSHSEFEEGQFGYCPVGAEATLYAWGVKPNGEVHNLKPVVIDYARFNAVKDSETFESLA